MPWLHWFPRMAGVSDSIALKVKDIMVSARVFLQMIALTINDRTVTAPCDQCWLYLVRLQSCEL